MRGDPKRLSEMDFSHLTLSVSNLACHQVEAADVLSQADLYMGDWDVSLSISCLDQHHPFPSLFAVQPLLPSSIRSRPVTVRCLTVLNLHYHLPAGTRRWAGVWRACG